MTQIQHTDGSIEYTASDELIPIPDEPAAWEEPLRVYETIEGAAVTLNAAGGYTYLCGELTSLTIASAAESPAETLIRFRSPAAGTSLSIPESLRTAGYWTILPNCSYELSIASSLAILVSYE